MPPTPTSTRPEGLEVKAASASPESGLIAADDATGVVEAIVSVTGVKDEVDDVILPGAYTDTLTKRTPKGVFVHDWGRWVARTEHIEELRPGDGRLPKQTKDGKQWPAEAGGLYVRARFNLATREGKDAYHNVKFFSETGECDWSIGYKVPKGGAVRTKDGIRHIQRLDLFEYSPVLFGAASSFSGTLSVKSADVAGEDGPDEGAPPEGDMPVPPPLDDPPAQDPDVPGDAPDDGDALHAAAVPHLDDDDVSAPDAPEVKDGVPKVADTPKDQAAVAKLKAWYVRGEGAAKIRWGTPGDFMRCVDLAGKHMSPEHARGFCQLRHKDALGKYAGQERPEGKKDVEGAAVEEVPDELYPFLEGTFEETRDLIASEATKEWGGFVDVVGTWADHAVVVCYPDGGDAPETWDVPFEFAEGKVVLGEPAAVRLTVEGGGDVENGEDLLPYPAVIETVAAEVKMLLLTETKAGRVLSSANENRLRGAVKQLVSILKSAGIDLGDEDERPVSEPAVDSSAPSAQVSIPEGKVLLDPALAARAFRLAAHTHDE